MAGMDVAMGLVGARVGEMGETGVHDRPKH